jgi:Domain of unknown function (DUF1918)
MQALTGDRLIVNGDPRRVGLIMNVPHADGSPPYVVRWQATGHIAMVSPGPYCRIIRGDDRNPREAERGPLLIGAPARRGPLGTKQDEGPAQL